MKILTAILCGLMLTGCTVSKVEPWDRQYLARPEMAWDADAAGAAYQSHVYFSKEASNGGASAGAGGCGCN